MNEKEKSRYNKNINDKMPLYFNILFYINAINQNLYSQNDFDSKYIKKVGIKKIPKNVLFNYKKNYFKFEIEHYLLSLFYYDMNENDLLLQTYLKYFEPKYKDNNFKAKTISLCLLFAEKFRSYKYFSKLSILKGVIAQKEFNKTINIMKIFTHFSNENNNKFYLRENNIFNLEKKDKKNDEAIFIKPSLLTSIILLKRALPYILKLLKDWFEIDDIKLYDFDNKLINYNSLDDIDNFYQENSDEEDEDEDDPFEDFITNYFNLLNYTLREIVLTSNNNNFVYDFSRDLESEKLEKDISLKKIYYEHAKEMCEGKENEEELNKKILDLHFNNFINCYSRKGEWLLVKYMKRKMTEKPNFQDDIDSSEDEVNISEEIDLDKKSIINNITKEKSLELIKKLKINWNFTFIEYNFFLIYITLNELNEKINKKISTDNGLGTNLRTEDRKILTSLKQFLCQYEQRDFFYLLKEFIFEFYEDSVKNPEHIFPWISNMNSKKWEYIKPDFELDIDKLIFKGSNALATIKEERSNNFFPTCAEKGIVYEGIPENIKSFIFNNYSQTDTEKYFNDFNYIYNHISLLDH